MSSWIAFAFGLIVGAGLVFRVAQIVLSELRMLHRIVLEMKRRMSVAKLTEQWSISFDAGGDPERYGSSASCYGGEGSVARFLWTGDISDPPEDAES